MLPKLLLLLISLTLLSAERLPNDDRELQSPNSPKVIEAVGRLQISNHEINKMENCSATLIALNATQDSNLVLTAGHCIPQGRVDKHNRFKSVTFFTNSGRSVTARIENLLYYQLDNRNGDIALLRLTQRIDHNVIAPIAVINPFWSQMQEFSQPCEAIMKEEFAENVTVIEAGFHGDSLGRHGTLLSYDSHFERNASTMPLRQYRGNYNIADSVSYEGSSGGAIIIDIENENASGTFLAGVIVGYPGEKSIPEHTVTLYTRLSGYMDRLLPIIMKEFVSYHL